MVMTGGWLIIVLTTLDVQTWGMFTYPTCSCTSYPFPHLKIPPRGPCSGSRNLTPCQEMLWKSSKNREIRRKKYSYSTGNFQVHLLGKLFFHSEFWSIKWIQKKIMEFCFIINFTMKILWSWNIYIYIYVEHCRTTVLPQYWINRCRPCNKEEVSPLFHPFSDSDHYHQNVNVWGPLSCIPFSHVYGELREVPRTYPQTSWQTWPGRSPAHLVRGFPS